jgi:hypothetical protein
MARLALPEGGAAVRDLRYMIAFRRDIARAHKLLAMLKARPNVEGSDADRASEEGNGDADESGGKA